MNDHSVALAKEIDNLRVKLGKSIEADIKAGTKALASQQKKTIAVRKKVATATARLAKARTTAKTRPTASNKAKLVKLRDDLAALKVDLKSANDAKRDINAAIAAAKELLREHKATERAIASAQSTLKKAARKKGPTKQKAAAKKATVKRKTAVKRTASKKASVAKAPRAKTAQRASAKRKAAVKPKAVPKSTTSKETTKAAPAQDRSD